MPRYFTNTRMTGLTRSSQSCDERRLYCALVSYRADRMRMAGCTACMASRYPCGLPTIFSARFGQPFASSMMSAACIAIDADGSGTSTVADGGQICTGTPRARTRPARTKRSRKHACKRRIENTKVFSPVNQFQSRWSLPQNRWRARADVGATASARTLRGGLLNG